MRFGPPHLVCVARFHRPSGSVFAWLCCSREEVDSHRFARTLQGAIDAGELAAHSRFTAWAKRVARKPEPVEGGGGADDRALVAAIRARPGRAASFLDDLEKRYGGGDAKGKKKRGVEKEGGAARPKRRRAWREATPQLDSRAMAGAGPNGSRTHDSRGASGGEQNKGVGGHVPQEGSGPFIFL